MGSYLIPVHDTASSPVDPSALHRLALDLAGSAAELVRHRRFGRDGAQTLTVSSKSTGSDLVTDVDHAVEAHLLERLRAIRPEDAVLGEEGGESAGTSGVRWVLDPIDGTVNFVLGLAEFAVSVAAELEGEVVAGVVVTPMTGELFHAVRGGGAWLGDRRLTGPRAVSLDLAVVGTGFSYDPGRRRAQAQIVAELIGHIADIRRIGSAALDLCFVAAGRLDAYFEAGLHPWDSAAGLLVATESGAVASGLRGRAPDGRLTAVAGPRCAQDLFATLAHLGADQLD